MHYTCSWGSHKESWQSPVFRNMILHLWLIFIASPDLERELDALWSLPTQWLFLLLVTAPQYPSVWPVWRLLFKASAPQFEAMPHCWSSQAWEGCWKQLTCHLEAPETCCLNLIHKNPQREQSWHLGLEGSLEDVLLAAVWACPSQSGLSLPPTQKEHLY